MQDAAPGLTLEQPVTCRYTVPGGVVVMPVGVMKLTRNAVEGSSVGTVMLPALVGVGQAQRSAGVLLCGVMQVGISADVT